VLVHTPSNGLDDVIETGMLVKEMGAHEIAPGVLLAIWIE
jgi:hypothetical protein